MTTHRSFKRLVRARMARTGERYAAARAVLLRGEPVAPAEPAPLATTDDRIRERTGRGWEEWFDQLDAWGAAERSHRDIARWVAEQLSIGPLVWEAQAVTGSYERARGLRAVGEMTDGFRITASRTVGVPVEQLYDAVLDPSRRTGWLDVGLHERTATRPKVAHFDAACGRVHLTFAAKDPGRSTVYVEHARLADAATADTVKAQWRAALATLKGHLEEARDA